MNTLIILTTVVPFLIVLVLAIKLTISLKLEKRNFIDQLKLNKDLMSDICHRVSGTVKFNHQEYFMFYYYTNRSTICLNQKLFDTKEIKSEFLEQDVIKQLRRNNINIDSIKLQINQVEMNVGRKDIVIRRITLKHIGRR